MVEEGIARTAAVAGTDDAAGVEEQAALRRVISSAGGSCDLEACLKRLLISAITGCASVAQTTGGCVEGGGIEGWRSVDYPLHMRPEVKKRSKGVTTVSRKHQITVPVDALRSAGIRVGDRLRVSATEDGRIVLERQANRVLSFAGALSRRLDTEAMERLRDEWD